MSKRPPMQPLDAHDLDPAVFNGKTVPQPDPVAIATAPRVTSPAPAVATVEVPPPLAHTPKRRAKEKVTPASNVPPSRVGKVPVTFWTLEKNRARLKASAALKGRSLDDLLNEKVEELLKGI
jgi:hypothetical protein